MYVYLPSSPKRSGKIACVSQTKKKGKEHYDSGKKSFKDSLYLFLNGCSRAAKSSVRSDSHMHNCQFQKQLLTCAPGLKQNALKTSYFLTGVTTHSGHKCLWTCTHTSHTLKWPVTWQWHHNEKQQCCAGSIQKLCLHFKQVSSK